MRIDRPDPPSLVTDRPAKPCRKLAQRGGVFHRRQHLEVTVVGRCETSARRGRPAPAKALGHTHM